MIKISNLSKKFNKDTIFSDINIDIKEWEMVVIDGKSWSWKTTILKIISWLDKNYSGKVKINSIDLSKLSTSQLSKFRRENIWIVFQFFNLYDDISVYENIIFLSKFYNLWKNTLDKAEILLNRLWIYYLKDKKISNLSGWELQRIAIARALFNEAKILLLDEPTSHLDEKNIEIFFNLLEELKKEYSLTILCVAHDDFTKKYFSKTIKLW